VCANVQLLAGQRLQRATFDFSESDEVIVILEWPYL
jgi:hypothetical protein